MTWQLAIVLFFVSTTIGGILRRKFSKTTNHDAGLISFVQHGGVILPLGILWSLTQSVHFSFSSAVHFWIFTLCAAIAGVVFNILSFKSQKTVDAGQFAIIGNLSTPLVVLLSVLLLHESLSGYQLLGMMCILGGASVVIGSPKNTKAALQKHVWYAVIAAVLTGVTIIVERYAIKASSVVVYILIGWLIQAVILAIFTRKKLHTARTISRSELLHIGDRKSVV